MVDRSDACITARLSTAQDTNLAGKTGVVRNTLGTRAAVYLFDDGQEVDIPGSFLSPVPPNKNDKVWEPV